ncbi:hypothetical protein B0H12DRAFT_1237023 [Mycena haematopus]|nr:hypothetical protein B0H12DRAFT_1237023 [Mycena haematopus]
MGVLTPSASTLNVSHTNQEQVSASTQTLNTSNVNRDRINHANAVLSRLLPYRRIEDCRPTINSCLVAGADVPMAKVLILVYPPIDPDSGLHHYLLYRTIHPDFVVTLEGLFLAYCYELRLDSSVNAILRQIVTNMALLPGQFIFPTVHRASTSASTTVTTVQLLGM